MVTESELASRSNPPSVRRISKAAKDMAVAHYAAHISRVRRWEKLVPTRRMHRPLLVRLYLKLGVLHEMQGVVDRSVLCYQEVAALLSEMVPQISSSASVSGSGGSGGGGSSPSVGAAGMAMLLEGADSMEQIRGVAELVHLRLLRNHLQRNMSVEGAIRQLKRHVAAFGRIPTTSSASRSKTMAGGRGAGAGAWGGGVLAYRHHAWLSRQYLTFGEMLGEHLSQFPMPPGQQSRIRGDGGGLGYASPGYYYLGAALQAVRRRKTSERLLQGVDAAHVEDTLSGLEVQDTLYLGESVRLLDPNDAKRNLRSECRAFLSLEEMKADRAEMARSLLTKALEHLPADQESFRRRRVLVLAHLGEESFVSGRYEEALECLPSVWHTYLKDGWLQLAAETLRRVHHSAWRAGKAKTVADVALRMAGKPLWPWVSEQERMGLLARSLPLVGAVERAAAVLGAEGTDGEFAANTPAEGDGSEALEALVDDSRLVMRLSGKFACKEASPGDSVVLTVGLLSLLPLEIRLDSLELFFNQGAMNCTVHDSKRNSGDINNSDGELSAAAISTADLTLPANGLLTVDVPVMVAGIIGQQALSSSSKEQALRLLGARALLRNRPSSSFNTAAGVAFAVSASTHADLVTEEGGRVWARQAGHDTVLLVGPRARVRVSIAAPPPLLLGATNRLLVKVTAVVSNKNESAALSSSSSSLLSMSSTQAATELSPSFNKNNRNEEKTNPFSNALLFLESEPAPVPPPPVVTVTLETAAASEDGGAAKQQQQQQPALLASSARPRAERAFFWAPAQASLPPSGDGAGGPAGDQEIARVGTEGDGGVAGFLPMAVGSDGQPVEGIPLLKTASSAIVAAATPAAAADSAASGLAADIAADIAVVAAGSSDSGEGEVTVTVPVWVRSETAGKVAVRARVVFGGEGMAVVAADAQRAGGSGHSVVGSTAGGASVGHVKAATAGGWQGAAVTATEWARAEVLCVRPLAAAVDVITLQDGNPPMASFSASGMRGANKPYDLAQTRPGYMVVVKTTITNLQEKSLEIFRMEIVPPAAAPSTVSGDGLPSSIPTMATTPTTPNPRKISWAHLPNGPVLHDDAALPEYSSSSSSFFPSLEKSRIIPREDMNIIVLAGTGDGHSCCFLASGDAEYPSPLGRLRVTWRATEDEGALEGSPGSCGAAAITDFPLPVLSARPAVVSARLRAPPHARVGEAFYIRWEISNPTNVYSSLQLTAEDGGEFVWSGKRRCALQVAPSETLSVTYRLVPLVPGHVLLPKVGIVTDKDKVNIVPDLSEGRSHIFVRP